MILLNQKRNYNFLFVYIYHRIYLTGDEHNENNDEQDGYESMKVIVIILMAKPG